MDTGHDSQRRYVRKNHSLAARVGYFFLLIATLAGLGLFMTVFVYGYRIIKLVLASEITQFNWKQPACIHFLALLVIWFIFTSFLQCIYVVLINRNPALSQKQKGKWIAWTLIAYPFSNLWYLLRSK